MKVGISYWGFCESFLECETANTPDGHRYGRPILIDDLRQRGHEVYALQQRREKLPYKGTKYSQGLPELDVLFVEWRWPTYKNFGDNKFEPDLDRQIELMDHYHDRIPLVVWDTDLKLTPEDEARWPNMIVADPTLNPKSFLISRMRLTFWSDFKPLLNPVTEGVEFGYVGNNYEREKMFEKYYSKPSKTLRTHGIQTKVWGNWLQRSPERVSPETLIRCNQSIAFNDRVSFRESMKVLNKFICTVHITKSRYAKQGFCSPRYLENIVVATPALVPEEFATKDILGKRWTVGSTSDIVSCVREIKKMNEPERLALVEEQKWNLMKFHDFSVSHVSEFLEAVAVNPVQATKNMQ